MTTNVNGEVVRCSQLTEEQINKIYGTLHYYVSQEKIKQSNIYQYDIRFLMLKNIKLLNYDGHDKVFISFDSTSQDGDAFLDMLKTLINKEISKGHYCSLSPIVTDNILMFGLKLAEYYTPYYKIEKNLEIYKDNKLDRTISLNSLVGQNIDCIIRMDITTGPGTSYDLSCRLLQVQVNTK